MRDSHPKITILGSPFTFRTLHGEDGWSRHRQDAYTLDRLMTVTLSAIPGLKHHEKASLEVVI